MQLPPKQSVATRTLGDERAGRFLQLVALVGEQERGGSRDRQEHDPVALGRRRHSGREYTVYLLGFAPGFAYLGDLDPALVLPRRPAPRTRVPAGSVAIAGSQTGVYPLTTPGGWHLIGSTTTRMFDPAREPAALLRAGDRVRFEPIR